MPIVVVTGASGTLGRQLVPRLLAAGHEVHGVSRRPRSASGIDWRVADLRTGVGVPAAVGDAEAIVHCATGPRHDDAMTLPLLAAAGHAHVVYPSIVGVDQVPLGYYRTKLTVENQLAASGVPSTILRATQFHDLLLRLFTTQRCLPGVLVPSATRFQPVDAGEVADRLVACVAAGPSGRVADLGGPEVAAAADLAHEYLRTRGSSRPVVAVRVPGKIGRGYRAGGHVTADQADGRITFGEFLARH